MTNTASKGGNKKRKPTLIEQAQCLRPYEEIFAFLPCNNKKYPPIKGWQNKSFSIDEIGGFNFVAAIGVRTNVGNLFCIDIDGFLGAKLGSKMKAKQIQTGIVKRWANERH